jgi:hypothetical protein
MHTPTRAVYRSPTVIRAVIDIFFHTDEAAFQLQNLFYAVIYYVQDAMDV